MQSSRFNNAGKVVRSRSLKQDDYHQECETKLGALQAAIEEGEASGDFDGFDPVRNLAELDAWHDS